MKTDNGIITAATLLIVDDDRDIRESLAAGLDLPGIKLTIHTAEDAASALVAAGRYRPDVMILDYNMPMGDGFEVANAIRSTPELKYMAIVMLTAQDTPERNWQSVEHDIDAFIGKPFELADIEAHVYSLLTSLQEGGRRGKPSQ